MRLLTASLLFLTLSASPLFSQNLDQVIQLEMNEEKLPGLAACVVKGGEVVWMRSFGFADVAAGAFVDDSMAFLLASVSKTVTATALLQLHEQGLFGLDEPVNDYLPFVVQNPNHPGIPITFRQLMTHTSSIRDNWTVMDGYYNLNGDPTISLEEVATNYFPTNGSDYYPQNFYNYAPGSDWQYSNIAVALMGYLVQVIADMPFDEYCEQTIFEPICMSNTGWFLADFEPGRVATPHYFSNGQYVGIPQFGFADYPNGLLRASIQDVAQFMLAYLEGGTLGGNEILTAATIDSVFSLQVPSIDPYQGLIWYTDNYGGYELWGHNGGEAGASTDLFLNPGEGWGVAVLANGEGYNGGILDALVDYAVTAVPSGNWMPPCSTVSSTTSARPGPLRFFPNPVQGDLQLDLPAGWQQARLSLVDALGRTVKREELKQATLNLAGLPAGVYYLELEIDGLNYAPARLVKAN